MLTNIQSREKRLAISADELKLSKVDYLREIDLIQNILSDCRALRRSPLPYLQIAQESATLMPTPPSPKGAKCPYCEYHTTKGLQGLKAHIGMKHKGKPMP